MRKKVHLVVGITLNIRVNFVDYPYSNLGVLVPIVITNVIICVKDVIYLHLMENINMIAAYAKNVVLYLILVNVFINVLMVVIVVFIVIGKVLLITYVVVATRIKLVN